MGRTPDGPGGGDVTRLLEAVNQGGEGAEGRLVQAVYGELRHLAASRLRGERPGSTLDATALVNEAWLRLSRSTSFENRRHFFGAAAEAMRRILVDRARRNGSLKRGGGRVALSIEDVEIPTDPTSIDVLALDEALARLAAEDAPKARLVELRHFAGLSTAEAAEVLEISPATADRWWAYARAFLFAEITKGDEGRRG